MTEQMTEVVEKIVDAIDGHINQFPETTYRSMAETIAQALDYEGLVAERDKLREALTEVMQWIDNWSPSFAEDDEWPDTNVKARQALSLKTGGEHD